MVILLTPKNFLEIGFCLVLPWVTQHEVYPVPLDTSLILLYVIFFRSGGDVIDR